MNTYEVTILHEAYIDISNLYDVIAIDYDSPMAAAKYIQGVLDTLNSLKKDAPIYQIQTRASLRQYGQNVRRINYKKMSIIYTIHGDVVYIHRIVASSLISGL